MTLKQAVKKLGGASKAAKAVGIPRTTVIYWMKGKTPPMWRQPDIGRIIAMARAA